LKIAIIQDSYSVRGADAQWRAELVRKGFIDSQLRRNVAAGPAKAYRKES
jgi:hypothetical protein